MKPVAVLLLLLLAPSLCANERVESSKLTPDPLLGFFGFKLALDGGRLAVGAREFPYHGPGRVFVYERIGMRWRETAQVVAAESLDEDRFGDGVALQGDLMVVGASARDDTDHDGGAAYVFELTGSGWVERFKLPHDSGFSDEFGAALDIDGDRIVAGSEDGESVYVYERAGNSWNVEARIDGPGQNDASFGAAVSIDGDRLVIGAPDDGTSSGNQGAVYLYERVGSTWTLVETFTSSPYVFHNHFGHAVELEGDRFIASTKHAGLSYPTSVFCRDASGNWTEEGRLKPAPGTDQHGFGESVALSGDLALVSSNTSNLGPHNAGVINWYILEDDGWTRGGELVADEAQDDALLGWGLDCEGRTVVGGAWGIASVYTFDLGCEQERNYCAGAVNSSGSAATMTSTGSQSIAANDFTLIAEGCPPDTSALFLYARSPQRRALGDGFLCLGATQPRFRLRPTQRADATGRVDRALDYPGLPAGGSILPGSTWYFQCIFRDPAAGGSGFNLSDGLEASFCP